MLHLSYFPFSACTVTMETWTFTYVLLTLEIRMVPVVYRGRYQSELLRHLAPVRIVPGQVWL